MSTDAESKEPKIAHTDLWSIPEVLGVEAALARYPEPRVHYVGTTRIESREAVEILVQTAGEFPVRALSPALFVGDLAIVEYEIAGESLYRFFAFEIEKLEEGAPIAIGWPQFPERKRETQFRFEILREEQR